MEVVLTAFSEEGSLPILKLIVPSYFVILFKKRKAIYCPALTDAILDFLNSNLQIKFADCKYYLELLDEKSAIDYSILPSVDLTSFLGGDK